MFGKVIAMGKLATRLHGFCLLAHLLAWSAGNDHGDSKCFFRIGIEHAQIL